MPTKKPRLAPKLFGKRGKYEFDGTLCWYRGEPDPDAPLAYVFRSQSHKWCFVWGPNDITGENYDTERDAVRGLQRSMTRIAQAAYDAGWRPKK